eukprot:CAMPEP_0172415294 /NCGR_PEP_ID=MMETSP1064-20121228/1738_1 /TAXON_ID=202472 /ORGANISM="Aulacoseira subarctica , Strain CCAP 1002/5" /LENGTH=299 /DNA_ID=CAMNT_0013152231 /DNA_START=105 /DNA_END=1004 /DNA_ORIENTATION=-
MLPMFSMLLFILVAIAVRSTNAFTLIVKRGTPAVNVRRTAGIIERKVQQQRCFLLPPLEMGRAAAVRAKTKGKTDARKSKINAIYGKKIIMAVKAGGSPNPEANSLLKETIVRAKANNVPVDNINRAIKKATEANTADFAESLYEAYGHGGASFVISVLSDNANRANMEIRSAVGKNHGKMAEQGSVLFMYDRKGKLEVEASLDEEQLMNAAIEAGVDDYEISLEDDDYTIVYVVPKDVTAMSDAIQTSLGQTSKFSLAYVTKAPVEVSDEDFEKNMKIIDALMELDDVDQVEHNMSIL